MGVGERGGGHIDSYVGCWDMGVGEGGFTV